MKFFKKIKNKLKFKRKTTLKNPTVFINRDTKKHNPLSQKKQLQKISKRSFTKNAPINLLGKLTQISKWIWLTVILGILITATYFLLFTNIFLAKKIIIFEGDQESTNLQIRRIVEPLRNRSILLFSSQELSDSIQSRVDNLTNLTIQKKLPDTVVIRYEKFQDVANVVNMIGRAKVRKSFILNQNGILTEQDKISSTLPTITIETDIAFNLQDKIITIKDLDYLLKAKDNFEEKFNLKITEIKYLPIAKEVRLKTERNFEIWLDIVVPYQEQLTKLKNAIPKINIYEGDLQYIDLRIQSAEGQKIIYR